VVDSAAVAKPGVTGRGVPGLVLLFVRSARRLRVGFPRVRVRDRRVQCRGGAPERGDGGGDEPATA
jgi:hypothetical protein